MLILMGNVTWTSQRGSEVDNSLGGLYAICNTMTTPNPRQTLKMSHAINIEPIFMEEVTGTLQFNVVMP